MTIDRRRFLRAAGVGGGGVLLGGAAGFGLARLLDDDGSEQRRESVLDGMAADCPIDTVVVLMLENRSFDHFYGWLGADERYHEAGRSRYGARFTIDARVHEMYDDPSGTPTATVPIAELGTPNPVRGCDQPSPGHSWTQGRAERDAGFLADGTGNSTYAISYFDDHELPIHARLARRFTVADHSHASLLSSTFPNRQYVHSAQSGGRQDDPGPLDVGIYPEETIWDRLDGAGVSAHYYYTDLPCLLLYGDRMSRFIRSIDHYFDNAGAGRLPHYTFIAPGFTGPLRTDDHPHGDVNVGQRFILELFRAFAESPQWERGLFVLTYDEWGGFFDHVPPPILPDDRASPDDADNFGQAGFRVPTVLASPHALRGFVDHTVYDHTSILRFLEWRFLGAPPTGPGGAQASWFLTLRDRYANNMGASIRQERVDADVGFDLHLELPEPSPACPDTPPELDAGPFTPSAAYRDHIDQNYPGPSETPWIENVPPPTLPTTAPPS